VAAAGRPAGDYSLSYRFVPGGDAGGRRSDGLKGIITIPVRPSGSDPWYTATITPSDDIAKLWPDLDYRDFALYGLTLSAVSTGDNVGEHTIIFSTLGETLELVHRGHTRDSYARGALLAAKFLAGKQPGRYTMDDVLGL